MFTYFYCHKERLDSAFAQLFGATPAKITNEAHGSLKASIKGGLAGFFGSSVGSDKGSKRTNEYLPGYEEKILDFVHRANENPAVAKLSETLAPQQITQGQVIIFSGEATIGTQGNADFAELLLRETPINNAFLPKHVTEQGILFVTGTISGWKVELPFSATRLLAGTGYTIAMREMERKGTSLLSGIGIASFVHFQELWLSPVLIGKNLLLTGKGN